MSNYIPPQDQEFKSKLREELEAHEDEHFAKFGYRTLPHDSFAPVLLPKHHKFVKTANWKQDRKAGRTEVTFCVYCGMLKFTNRDTLRSEYHYSNKRLGRSPRECFLDMGDHLSSQRKIAQVLIPTDGEFIYREGLPSEYSVSSYIEMAKKSADNEMLQRMAAIAHVSRILDESLNPNPTTE